MDKFSSFASQAKAKAEAGRAQVMNQYHGSSSSSSRPAAPSPPTPSSPTGFSRPPPGRARAGTGTSAGGGTFIGIGTEDREAFFSLLDEYFTSRPQFAEALGVGAQAAAPPPPIAAPTPVVRKPAAPAPPPAKRGLGKAVALYDYAGGEPEDLPFREGDNITILEKVSDDWWKGELQGKSGIFPSAYVQME